MKDIAAKISSSELAVLEVLWQSDEALPISSIRLTLEQQRGWDGSTIKTLLRRLCEKGAVKTEKRDVFYYSPAIEQEEYQRWSTHSLINRVYQGSAGALVASLIQGNQLSQQEIEELRTILYPEERHG